MKMNYTKFEDDIKRNNWNPNVIVGNKVRWPWFVDDALIKFKEEFPNLSVYPTIL